MNRRDALKTTAAATAASSMLLDAQDIKPVPKAWAPQLLSPVQLENVIALTDQIIPRTDTPGAKDAEVYKYIDLFLKDGDQTQTERFLQGLAWLDKYTQDKYGAAFSKLTSAQQVEALTAMDQGAQTLPEGNQFFRLVKSMTSRFYYSTKQGQQELNKHWKNMPLNPWTAAAQSNPATKV